VIKAQELAARTHFTGIIGSMFNMSSIGSGFTGGKKRKAKANKNETNSSSPNSMSSNRSVFVYTGQNKDQIPKDAVSVRLHPSITEIGVYAFSYRDQLREVVLNDGLERIWAQAFDNCSSLESITFPSSLTTFGHGVFLNCKSLKRVVFNDGLRKIEDNLFYGCDALESVTLPSTTLAIGNGSFKGCKQLKEVAFNESLRKIGCCAFEDCLSLESITFPSSLTNIGSAAFSDCIRLNGVALFNEDVKIEKDSFKRCVSLKRFTFPIISKRLKDIICCQPKVEKSIGKPYGFIYKILRRLHISQPERTEVEIKIDKICKKIVERNDSELYAPATFVLCLSEWDKDLRLGEIRRVLVKIDRLISHYEKIEGTTMFALALWKAKIDQANDNNSRDEYRVEVPEPVKDTILQYLFSEVENLDSESEQSGQSPLGGD